LHGYALSLRRWRISRLIVVVGDTKQPLLCVICLLLYCQFVSALAKLSSMSLSLHSSVLRGRSR
jgi:hypothetical protein